MSVPTLEGLSRYGWDEALAASFERYEGEGLAPARVAAQHRGRYELYAAGGELAAEIAGRLAHLASTAADLPVVGDWVAVRARPDEGAATIHAVLPRRTKFSRKVPWLETEEQVLAANVDRVLLVTGLDQNFNVRRLERYLTMAWESGAQPAIVLTKSDLADDVELKVGEVEAVAFGVPVHAVSNLTGEGIGALEPYLRYGQTVVLLGSSGVGKSSLVNRLLGRELQRTFAVREDGRGRHTTTHRELLALPSGALILDTPGLRELQLWDSSDGFESAFADIADLAARCRFRDCSHATEPGCAVVAALRSETLGADRLESYRKLQRELRALDIRMDKRAQADERRKRRVFARSMRKKAW